MEAVRAATLWSGKVVPVHVAAAHGEAMLRALPFAIGKSPFRIKGVAYRGHIAYCDRTVRGGHAAVLDATKDPELRAYCSQNFLAGSRYDIFPLVLSAEPTARALGCNVNELLRRRARYQVGEDVSGVYRLLLGLLSPEFVAKRFSPLISQYLDFGGADVHMRGPGSALGVQRGVPLPLVGWYVSVTETYIAELLIRAGAKDPHVAYTTAQPDGTTEGLPTVELACNMEWTRPVR